MVTWTLNLISVACRLFARCYTKYFLYVNALNFINQALNVKSSLNSWDKSQEVLSFSYIVEFAKNKDLLHVFHEGYLCHFFSYNVPSWVWYPAGLIE